MMPTAQLLSMPDFPGSTVAILGCSGFLCAGADHLQALTPTDLSISTPRGQSVNTSNFKILDYQVRQGIKAQRVFYATFASN